MEAYQPDIEHRNMTSATELAAVRINHSELLEFIQGLAVNDEMNLVDEVETGLDGMTIAVRLGSLSGRQYKQEDAPRIETRCRKAEYTFMATQDAIWNPLDCEKAEFDKTLNQLVKPAPIIVLNRNTEASNSLLRSVDSATNELLRSFDQSSKFDEFIPSGKSHGHRPRSARDLARLSMTENVSSGSEEYLAPEGQRKSPKLGKTSIASTNLRMIASSL
ncbi:hypothetical protein M434DRAFT_31676 [Hypoxylon sp. CO27-5]|nr:hypothetical protein M434DRAFT_31676 [Hypoxylon sp. CO27-5]